MISSKHTIQQRDKQKQAQKNSALFTLIALASSLFLLICYLFSPKSGMEAMVILLPWFLVVGIHIVCTLLAAVFVCKTGKFLKNLGIILYFMIFWGIHLQLFISMNEIDVAMKAKLYEFTHADQARLYNTLKRYQHNHGGKNRISLNDKKEIITLIRNKTDITYIHPGNSRTIISLAAGAGDIDILTGLVGAGADIEGEAIIWAKPLMIATQRKHLEAVEFLLERGADPNSPDYTTASPLMTAIKQEDFQTAALLLAGGAQPNNIIKNSVSPLFFAATKARPELVNILLEAGADPDLLHFGKETPMLRAAKAECTDCVCLMTEAGGSNSGATSKGESPLFLALETANYDMANCLVSRPQQPDPNQKDLFLAITQNNLTLLKELLKYGVDPNTPNSSGQTILSQLLAKKLAPQFTEEQLLEIVKILMEANADIHQRDKARNSLLKSATKAHLNQIAAHLLQQGDLQRHLRDINQTVLFEAIRGGNTQLAKLYLDHGADLTGCGQKDCINRYLLAVVRSSNPAMTSLLLHHIPASLNTVQLKTLLRQLANQPEALATLTNIVELNQFINNNQTPLQIIWQSKNIESVLILLEAGAKPWLSINKNEPFRDFVRKGQLPLVRKSLQRFPELQKDLPRMKDAMYWAVRNGHVDVVEEIIQYGVFFNRIEEVYALLDWTKPPKKFPQAKEQIRKIFKNRMTAGARQPEKDSPLLQVLPGK